MALPPGVTPHVAAPAGGMPPGVTPRSAAVAPLPATPAPAPSTPETIAGRVMGMVRPLVTPAPDRVDLGLRALRSSAPPYIGAPVGVFLTPGGAQAAKETARTTLPIAVGALTGGASLPLQALAQAGTEGAMQATGVAEKSVPHLVAAGALPFLAAGVGRLARAIPRMATRLVPSWFTGAQRTAQKGAESIAAGMEGPAMGPGTTGDLFKATRGAAAEAVPATRLTAMLDDLEASIPKDPVSPGLKTTRELMDQARAAIGGDTIALGDLMKLRLDAGQSLKRAPQVAALYKGILGDLEQAGAAGGPGATLAMRALEMGRKEHGATLFRDLVEQASKRRSNLTGDLPLLDMAQLAKLVQGNRDELVKRLGPEGMGQIEQFVVANRALPPVDAYNFANKMALTGLGTAGFFGGGPVGAVGAAGLYELLNNAKAVGRNPAELNRFLIMLGEGMRAGGLAEMADRALKPKREPAAR